jgi:tetratricopeptide (TPR) repeat protein
MSPSVTKQGPNGVAASLLSTLRQAPATVPALAAVVLFIVWATSQGGYPLTHWAPGALIVLVLLGLALALVGLRAGEVPLPVKIAVGCLAGYTALSFASILWAAVPGEAWEGANRTLLYLLVFALFALWRQRGASAALLLGGWTLAMIALAAFVALHVNAEAGHLGGLFAGERLAYPTGYPNASAAQWLMAFWPALLLARSERLPWALRGVLAGGAVLLAEVALLSQSRGSLYATPVMLVLVFALLPGRVRTFAVLVPVAAGIGVAAPTVLHVGDRLKGNGGNVAAALHSATAAIFAAALVVGLVVAVGAAIESRRVLSPATDRRLHKGVAAVAVLALLAVLAGGLVAAGNPLTRVRHGWDTFKGGYAADNTGGNRLVSGLGSNRYDFYRVGLNEFVAHPLVGIGADNFEQQYLRYGRSDETPHYPHSIELRTLAQTGVIGALLALVGLAAALLAAARGLRGADPLGRAVVAAALAGFGYWVVHGSFDWFWEFAGLGAPAFAMLGLACALAPRGRIASRPRRIGWPAIGVGIAVALVAAASIAAPWLSQRQVQSAARVWTKSPQTAYARLNDAARLNPLSDEAYVVAGSIALRFDDLARADREFALALKRTPGDAYATLERGAIASTENDRRAALALLERAARLNPRDLLTRQALRLAREGKRVSVEELNRSILLNAQQLA